MKFYSIVIILLLSFPLISSWVNGIEMILSYRNRTDVKTDRMKRILVFFYACIGLNWFLAILLQYNWETYNYLSCFYSSLNFLWVLLFYHFVFLLTSVDKDESFSRLQYIFPLFFFVVLFIYPYFLTWNVNFITLNDQVLLNSDFSNSSFFLFVLAISRRLYIIFYGVLIILRIKRFKRDAPKEARINRWLWAVWWLFCAITLGIVFRLFNFPQVWEVISFIILVILFVTFQSIICFNILNDNFRFYSKPEEIDNVSGKRKYTSYQKVRYKSFDNKKKRVRAVIDRSEFENYFGRQKPYLNPKLTIDELAEGLGACRSIISSFVNKTYGINFSWYVNWWRLKEINSLMKMKVNQDKSARELYSKAGFGSYRNYQRVKTYFESPKKPLDEYD